MANPKVEPLFELRPRTIPKVRAEDGNVVVRLELKSLVAESAGTCERLSVVVADDETGVGFLDGPTGREVAGGHKRQWFK